MKTYRDGISLYFGNFVFRENHRWPAPAASLVLARFWGGMT